MNQNIFVFAKMCVWGWWTCVQCCTHMTSACRIQKAESPGASSSGGAERTACKLRSAASDFTLTAIWLAFYLIRATGPLRHGFACAVIPKKWGMHGSRMGGGKQILHLGCESDRANVSQRQNCEFGTEQVGWDHRLRHCSKTVSEVV